MGRCNELFPTPGLVTRCSESREGDSGLDKQPLERVANTLVTPIVNRHERDYCNESLA